MESVDVLFKLPYFNLFKYIFGSLSSLAFFFLLFAILSVWLLLLLTMTFFHRIVEELQKNYVLIYETILTRTLFLL